MCAECSAGACSGCLLSVRTGTYGCLRFAEPDGAGRSPGAFLGGWAAMGKEAPGQASGASLDKVRGTQAAMAPPGQGAGREHPCLLALSQELSKEIGVMSPLSGLLHSWTGPFLLLLPRSWRQS